MKTKERWERTADNPEKRKNRKRDGVTGFDLWLKSYWKGKSWEVPLSQKPAHLLNYILRFDSTARSSKSIWKGRDWRLRSCGLVMMMILKQKWRKCPLMKSMICPSLHVILVEKEYLLFSREEASHPKIWQTIPARGSHLPTRSTLPFCDVYYSSIDVLEWSTSSGVAMKTMHYNLNFLRILKVAKQRSQTCYWIIQIQHFPGRILWIQNSFLFWQNNGKDDNRDMSHFRWNSWSQLKEVYSFRSDRDLICILLWLSKILGEILSLNSLFIDIGMIQVPLKFSRTPEKGDRNIGISAAWNTSRHACLSFVSLLTKASGISVGEYFMQTPEVGFTSITEFSSNSGTTDTFTWRWKGRRQSVMMMLLVMFLVFGRKGLWILDVIDVRVLCLALTCLQGWWSRWIGRHKSPSRSNGWIE